MKTRAKLKGFIPQEGDMSRLHGIHGCLLIGLAGALVGTAIFAPAASAQTADTFSAQVNDPGVRGGPAGAGGPLPELNAGEKAFFAATRDVFQEIDSVSGTIAGEDGKGLGPR